MDALTARYQTELKRTRSLVADAVEREWRKLPEYRDAQVDPFLSKVLPVVKAGQTRAVALTNAYLSKSVGLSSPVGLSTDALTGAGVRKGVDPAVVYRRGFETVWSAVGTIGLALAVEKALGRLKSTAEMDVAMSARDASVAWGQAVNRDGSNRVSGWVRVADPGCCDFCQMIDGAKLYVDDPAPLHNNCGCTVEPLTDSNVDISGLLPGDTLDQVRIEEHGEMGPVITDKNDNFTSVDDLPDSYQENL